MPVSTLDTKGVIDKIHLVESQKFTNRQPSTGGTQTTGRVKDMTDRFQPPTDEETIRYRMFQNRRTAELLDTQSSQMTEKVSRLVKNRNHLSQPYQRR